MCGHHETILRVLLQRWTEISSRRGGLASVKDRTSCYLSGGEQQMLVIGRAMMARPKLMLIDEPSLGLAPLMVDEVFAVLKSLKDAGVTLLVVEQNARVALQLADRSEEHTSELQSLMRISYAVFCLKKKK